MKIELETPSYELVICGDSQSFVIKFDSLEELYKYATPTIDNGLTIRIRKTDGQ